ncbi:MAG: insulinase family protein [Treponema sp.]|nr:insulinase family protein [Treponema sp.]
MRKGETIEHFEILETVDLAELKARGIWARHESGAEVFHVLNDDDENMFAFAFSTPPEDSRGIPHILEHSVLCGSQKYPLKDTFLVLARGSLKTYLNAWTASDRTVYPASTVNKKDYYNLMAVYGDAVLRPLLSEWTFLQEAWRYEKSGGGLGYTGVVYNEMKGAYSTMDTYAQIWSVKAVLPDTIYALDSGGDPDNIPELSLKELKSFHQKYYSPANCKIFLAGNIPTKDQLEFLHRSILADVSAAGFSGIKTPGIKKAAPWNEARDHTILCPGEKGKAQVMITWCCGGKQGNDPYLATALGCLSEILLGHDGSPLYRALIESGLGEDLSPVTGFDAEMQEAVFSVGLRGVKTSASESGEPPEQSSVQKKIEALILGTLRRLAKEGLPPEEIEAALLGMEFSQREIKRSYGPYSMVWLRRSLQGWLFGKTPWDFLLFLPLLEKIKQNLAGDKRYFEKLIEEQLLGNTHRCLLTLESDEHFLEKKEAALEETVRQKTAQMESGELGKIKKQNAELEKIQTQADSQEMLAKIPHLSRADLKAEPVCGPKEFAAFANNVPCMVHPIFTNGITYVEFAFPLDTLAPEDYLWVTIFARSIVSMGLPGMDYGEVSSLLARSAGGFTAMAEAGSAAPEGDDKGDLLFDRSLRGREWIIYRVKMLDEKVNESLELARRLVTEADFTDHRRLTDLILELKNDMESSLAPSGHGYAADNSSRYFSRSKAAEEIWGGIEQYFFAHDLAAMNIEEAGRRLTSIRDALAHDAGILINITASLESVPAALKAAEKFAAFGPPRPPRGREPEALFALFNKRSERTAAVYASPSLRVGFAALSLHGSVYGAPQAAAEEVLAHELSTGALWESIRMMGGAYGANASHDNMEGIFHLSTYRDPNPLRSLKAFPRILKDQSNVLFDDDDLEKAIIGCFSGAVRPHVPSQLGIMEFIRSLYGIRHRVRKDQLEQMIALTPEDLRNCTRGLADDAHKSAASRPVVIAPPAIAKTASRELGVPVITLPL